MRHFWTRLGAALLICAWVSAPRLGHAHAEREVDSPPRSGPVPDPERAHGQTIDVCKGGSPCVAHIQEAVNAASDGALIRIWPGTYREEPSRNAEQLPPDGDGGVYTFEHHVDFPNSQNLIAIAGKKNLTLRGMGNAPSTS